MDQINSYPLVNHFNPSVSHLSQVSSIPSEIQDKVNDLVLYEIERDGITNRYQILVFPHLNCTSFLQEFLQFFLINSTIRNGNGDLSRMGFPFCLVSFQIGSLAKYMDDCEDVYLPTYVRREHTEFSQLRKCIYLFFDTHIGRGHEILQCKIENITLGNILSSRTLK
jgi:hypothetical protein